MNYVYGGTLTTHKNGEWCKRKSFAHYFISYFYTPFLYEKDGSIEQGKAGAVLIQPPNTPIFHGTSPNMQKGFVNDWAYVEGKEIDDLLALYPLPINHAFAVSDSNIVKNFILTLKDETEKKRYGWQKICLLKLEELLISLYRNYIYANDNEDEFDKARSYFFSTLQNKWTIKTMSAYLGYSSSYFCALYHKKYGVSPKLDLLSHRITLAKKLLIFTSLTIEEISLKTGWSNIYHFSKYFKSVEKLSPSAYRQKNI